MRRLAHFALNLLACIPWALAGLCALLVIGAALLGDWLVPGSKVGNCWSYALPKWWRQGGYLGLRWADAPMGFIPHVVWIRELPREAVTEQTAPLRRARYWWQAWMTLYFPLRVVRTERPHNAMGDR